MDAAKNFAKGTLSTGYDDTVTSIALLSGDGAKFPVAPFNAVWWNATDFPDPADDPFVEIIRVTAKSTDTLTVTRGQEGTGGVEHDDAGKVYRLIAPITAKLVNGELLNVTNTAGDYEIVGDAFTFNADQTVTVNAPTNVRLNASGMLVDATASVVGIGDLDGNNTGVAVRANDSLGLVGLQGLIGTDQTATATVGVGTIARKLQIFDLSGNSLGFIPIYGSIT